MRRKNDNTQRVEAFIIACLAFITILAFYYMPKEC